MQISRLQDFARSYDRTISASTEIVTVIRSYQHIEDKDIRPDLSYQIFWSKILAKAEGILINSNSRPIKSTVPHSDTYRLENNLSAVSANAEYSITAFKAQLSLTSKPIRHTSTHTNHCTVPLIDEVLFGRTADYFT